jgi:4-amino-4-deoxy-L-arabinose transferase-like glycosyltransferase
MGQPETPLVQRQKIATTFGRWWAHARTSFFWMLAIGFALRFGYILIAHTYNFKTLDNNFSFGWEMGRIGRAIATGHGFADPFERGTGPTAWQPPLYPYLIAGVFRLTGIYTRSSALVLLGFNGIFSALTCVPMFVIARRCFSEKVAVWSAWAWALFPSFISWSTRSVWETSLAALILAVLFWLTLRLEDLKGATPWIGFGLLWGVAALTNTSLISFLPASGLWAWRQRWKKGRPSLAGVVLAAIVFAGTIAPWLIRNYETFGKFIFIRSNFGAELRLGNGPNADGLWMDWAHPSRNTTEMRRYQQMGEMAYVAQRRQEAIGFIGSNYGRFARISVRRLIYYWAGLPSADNPVSAAFQNALLLASSVLAFWGLGRSLLKGRPGAWLFLWLIVFYPLVYYFVFVLPRYRHPIEPELLILMVYVMSEAETRSLESRAKTA